MLQILGTIEKKKSKKLDTVMSQILGAIEK